MKEFNIFSKLRDFEHDFDNEKVKLAESKVSGNARYLDRESGTYAFSQRDTLNAIDMAMNSQFQTGRYDSEGQRKVYLNTVRFIRDVSRMRTDIDVKNYVFDPDTAEDQWPVYLMSRKFRIFAREEDWGETLNRLGDDYVTYGTCVSKRVGKEVKRVPLKTLKNTQSACSLKEAAECGGYVIECHDGMHYSEMREMKEWDIEELDKDQKYDVREIYTLMPKSYIAEKNGRKESSQDMVPAMAVIVPEKNDDKSKDAGGKILFIEQIDEAPYEEAHWSRQDGRWLGRGPVEDQLENQIARNLTANLRRRSLLHSSKRLYQSSSEEVAKNLVKDVRDGQVIMVGANGQITPIANETRNLSEFSADEAVWDKNAQQMSFTFEVATGESMPSGTPFRLGIILSNAIESHFELKREQFGLFLKRSFFAHMIPIFQKQTKAHTLAIASSSENVGDLIDAVVTLKANERYVESLASGNPATYEEIRATTEDEARKSPYFFIDVPDGYYKDIKYHMELDITDEATDTKAEVETLTTLYTSMAQTGDPRVDKVLEAIFAKTGKNLQSIAGKGKTPAPQAQGAMPQVTQSPQNAATAL